MHELSVTRRIVSIVTCNARGRCVYKVHLRIGKLSGVVPQAVRFCFEACAKGTVVEGAEVVIDEVSGVGECLLCKKHVAIEHPVGICPCEVSAPLRVVAGEELMVSAIEMEAE